MLIDPSAFQASWSAGTCCHPTTALGIDDRAYVHGVIDDLQRHYAIDATRIFLTGHSSGAQLAFKLAVEMSSRIAAFHANAGSMNFFIDNEECAIPCEPHHDNPHDRTTCYDIANPKCADLHNMATMLPPWLNPTRPLPETTLYVDHLSRTRDAPILITYGKRDSVDSFEGGRVISTIVGNTVIPPLELEVRWWLDEYGCAPLKIDLQSFTANEKAEDVTTCWTYPCVSNITVCESEIGGHAWPGLDESIEPAMCVQNTPAYNYFDCFVQEIFASSKWDLTKYLLNWFADQRLQDAWQAPAPAPPGRLALPGLEVRTPSDAKAHFLDEAFDFVSWEALPRPRSYYVYDPSPTSASFKPLVMYAHGSSGDVAYGAEAYELNNYARDGKSDLGPYIAVYLQAYPTCYLYELEGALQSACGSQGYSLQASWNAGACCAPATHPDLAIDDIAYVRAVLDDIALEGYRYDSRHVFALGNSNGGDLMYRIACEAGDRIAAVVSNAASFGAFDASECATECDSETLALGINGRCFDNANKNCAELSLPALYSCAASSIPRNVPIMTTYGVRDRVVPFTGGSGDPAGSILIPVSVSTEYFLRQYGCGAYAAFSTVSLQTSEPMGEATCRTWPLCPVNLTVCELADGAHGFPGRDNTVKPTVCDPAHPVYDIFACLLLDALESSAWDLTLNALNFFATESLPEFWTAPPPSLSPSSLCETAGGNTDWVGDGWCDDYNNIAECNYDDGDCCEATCMGDLCGVAPFVCVDPSVAPAPIDGPVSPPPNATYAANASCASGVICGDGECLWGEWQICDGVRDCYDFSDEIACEAEEQRSRQCALNDFIFLFDGKWVNVTADCQQCLLLHWDAVSSMDVSACYDGDIAPSMFSCQVSGLSYEWNAVCEAALAIDHDLLPLQMVYGSDSGRYVEISRGKPLPATYAVLSSTKFLTAAAVARLEEDGHAFLNASLGTYLKWWDYDISDPRSKITLSDLLSLSSGMGVSDIPLVGKVTDEVGASLVSSAWCNFLQDPNFCSGKSFQPGDMMYWTGAGHPLVELAAKAATDKETWATVFAKYLKNPLSMQAEYGDVPRLDSSAIASVDDFEDVLRQLLRSQVPCDTDDCERPFFSASGRHFFESPSTTKYQTLGWHLGQEVAAATPWSYALGLWNECESSTCDSNVRNAVGEYGFLPWLDKGHRTYSILGRYDAFKNAGEALRRSFSVREHLAASVESARDSEARVEPGVPCKTASFVPQKHGFSARVWSAYLADLFGYDYNEDIATLYAEVVNPVDGIFDCRLNCIPHVYCAFVSGILNEKRTASDCAEALQEPLCYGRSWEQAGASEEAETYLSDNSFAKIRFDCDTLGAAQCAPSDSIDAIVIALPIVAILVLVGVTVEYFRRKKQVAVSQFLSSKGVTTVPYVVFTRDGDGWAVASR